MSVITKAKERMRAKSVLLFSGGMDSLCFDHLCQPDVLLYAPSGAGYAARERRCILELQAGGWLHGELVDAGGVLDLARFERDDFIVANRNAYLVLLASHYGELIWLGSVDGDRSCDKDEGFYAHMKALLDHMWQAQHWTEARTFRVGSPYKTITKTELVRRYLAADGDPAALLTSYSCYHGDEQHCGVCKACARKRVALELNRIKAPAGYWRGNFWHEQWFFDVLPAIRAGTYRGAEDADFIRWGEL